MTAEPRKVTKKKSRPREPDVYYVVAIDDRDWGYSLSLNTERHRSIPTTNSVTSTSGQGSACAAGPCWRTDRSPMTVPLGGP